MDYRDSPYDYNNPIFILRCAPSRAWGLIVSDIPAEQDAAHLLFRGIFGLLRNVPHHRLLGELQPERVLQVLGTLDYCLAVAQGASGSVEEKHHLS